MIWPVRHASSKKIILYLLSECGLKFDLYKVGMVAAGWNEAISGILFLLPYYGDGT